MWALAGSTVKDPVRKPFGVEFYSPCKRRRPVGQAERSGIFFGGAVQFIRDPGGPCYGILTQGGPRVREVSLRGQAREVGAKTPDSPKSMQN